MGVIVTRTTGAPLQPELGRTGSFDIPSGAFDFTVTFTPALTGSYQVVADIVNTVDPSASIYSFTIIDKTTTTFKVELSGQTDSPDYNLDWIVTADGLSSGTGVYSPAEKLAIEMEMDFVAAKANYYKELSYTGANLTGVDIWTDAGKTEQIFGKVLTYTGADLSQTVLTRISDSITLIKDLVYTAGKLTSVTVTVV